MLCRYKVYIKILRIYQAKGMHNMYNAYIIWIQEVQIHTKKYTITARNNMKSVDMKKVKIIRLHTVECFSPVC